MQTNGQAPELANYLEGRVIYVLIVTLLIATIYPITESGSVVTLLLYQGLMATLMFSGIVVSRDSPRTTRLLIILGAVWLLTGFVYAFNQTAVWSGLIAYVALILYVGLLTKLLFLYIFNTDEVTRDVLYAAINVYLLLAMLFVTAFGILESLTFIQTGSHAFSGAGIVEGQPMRWQDLSYYSMATLTTLGYGDILPVTQWARSLAGLEAVTGVVYLAVVMARLVGVYAGTAEKEQLEDFLEKT